jgi:hypothetical protein
MFKFWKLQIQVEYTLLFLSDTPSDICNDLDRLRNIQILK